MSHADLAAICSAAYDGLPPPWVEISGIFAKGPKCFVSDGDPAVVVFVGTDDLLDMLADAAAILVPHDKWGLVHAGFATWSAILREAIWRTVGGRKVIATGHSMGGSLAALLASDRPEQIQSVVTFGSACPGDGGFAQGYAKAGLRDKTHHYALNLDPVPWTPPSRWGYVPHAPRCWILPTGIKGAIKTFWGYLRTAIKVLNPVNWRKGGVTRSMLSDAYLADHDPDAYAAALKVVWHSDL